MARSVSSQQFSSRLPQKGDIIKFPRVGGAYAHFGIYIGDGMIIHRSGPPGGPSTALASASSVSGAKSDKAEIRKDRLQDVIGDGQKAEIFNFLDEEYKSLSAEEIVRRATKELGKTGYNLLFKNCEHFVTWCRYGEAVSKQADIARKILAFVSPLVFLVMELVKHNSKNLEGQ